MGTALVVLINDVTLMKGDQIIVQVCFKGGATRTPHLPAPLDASDAHMGLVAFAETPFGGLLVRLAGVGFPNEDHRES